MNEEVKATNKLIELLEREVASTLRAYEESQVKLEQGCKLAKQLPDFITGIGWWSLQKRDGGKWYIETNMMDAIAGDELVRQMKLWGAQGMKSHYKAFNNTWCFTCSAMIDDILLDIKIDGGSKPPNCTIKEIKEFKEVITYEAICEETGEAV